jgi:hypothetical protein
VRRWLLLAATVWPTAYIAGFAVLLVRAIATNGRADAITSPVIIPVHVTAFLTVAALFVVYVRDLSRRDLSEEHQAIWGVLLALLGPPAMLAYWWRFKRAA